MIELNPPIIQVLQDINFIERYEKLSKSFNDKRTPLQICLEDNDKIDINNFRPEVESPNKDMYDNRAIYEIRILDGDLFYIISD